MAAKRPARGSAWPTLPMEVARRDKTLLMRLKISPNNGNGQTTTTARTWPLAAKLPARNRKWPRKFYECTH